MKMALSEPWTQDFLSSARNSLTFQTKKNPANAPETRVGEFLDECLDKYSSIDNCTAGSTGLGSYTKHQEKSTTGNLSKAEEAVLMQTSSLLKCWRRDKLDEENFWVCRFTRGTTRVSFTCQQHHTDGWAVISTANIVRTYDHRNAYSTCLLDAVVEVNLMLFFFMLHEGKEHM